ncbi:MULTISPECIES: Cthe_2314 family HEPN domain-containing protein [unclassified Paenibacillus]|uniref:Cthe_2314 family HEPN domain-containing protein n=1 Tax=unclassified Paenibacillus TaxID=185978 RepID=UPI002F3EF1C3
MLRFLFNESVAQPEGELAEAYQAMDLFISLLHKKMNTLRDETTVFAQQLRRYEIWTLGLKASLNELEQSHYAAAKFRAMIRASSLQTMSDEERLNYKRYVYFDKNGFIRVFSLLDKLGTLLNELLAMHTERVKPHFSYFTVLRNMRQKQVHSELMWALNHVKEKYKEPMNRLRKRRNTEIHYMNSEMHDDLIQSQRMYGEEYPLENVRQQASDLTDSLTMVTESLLLVFQYGCRLAHKKQL